MIRMVFLLAVCVFAECGDASERWRPIHVLGKEKTFYCRHDLGPGTAANRSYFPILGRWGDARGLNDILWFNVYRKPEQKFQGKMPYSVWETMGPDVPYNKSRENLKKLHETRPDVPFILQGFLDGRFPWFMKDSYDCDVESFRAFRRTYTNFVAFTTMNESDIGYSHFSTKGVTNLRMKAEIDAAFPPAKDYRDRVAWLDRSFARQRAMHFGTMDYLCCVSVNPMWMFALARHGVKYFECECESQVLSGPWRFAMMHVRGVGRQYGIPWSWYAAHLITSSTRDGKTMDDGEWHFPNKWKPREKWPKGWHENSGTSRSIIRRSHVYGYFSGANAIEIENPEYCLWDDLGPTPKLSKYGQDLEEVMQLAEKTPRGFCFTPVAVLTSVYEPFCRSGGNGFARDAFFFTLVPVLSEDGYRHRDEKKGEQGIMFNSEFGEIADVIVPDAGQKHVDFAATLEPYRWAFMMDSYDEKDFDRAAIEEWVNKGGTLVISVDYVEKGLVAANIAGVDFMTNIITCGKELIEAATKRVCEGSMHQTFRRKHNNRDYTASLDYELHVGTPTTAKPLYTDEKGNVIAWENVCGKGKVITITAVQSVPRIFADRQKYYKELPIDNFFGIKPEYVAGRVTFPIQRELLRKVQREELPVTVEGDIQWGVNRIESKSRVEVEERNGSVRSSTSTSNFDSHSHWLVWLLNNKGVKKFAYEDDDIDHAFDAKVRVTDKKTGKTVEVVVPAGGYTTVNL